MVYTHQKTYMMIVKESINFCTFARQKRIVFYGLAFEFIYKF